MKYMEYWLKTGNKWSIALSIIFTFSLGEGINSLVYQVTQLDSFLITAAIGIGTIYLVGIVLGYLKKNNRLKKW